MIKPEIQKKKESGINLGGGGVVERARPRAYPLI